MYQPPALQAVFLRSHLQQPASERAGWQRHGSMQQPASKQHRGSGARVLRAVSAITLGGTRGGPPAGNHSLCPTNKRNAALSLSLSSPRRFHSLPGRRLQPRPNPPAASGAVRAWPACPAAGRPQLRPARPAQQLASAQVTHSWPPPKAHART